MFRGFERNKPCHFANRQPCAAAACPAAAQLEKVSTRALDFLILDFTLLVTCSMGCHCTPNTTSSTIWPPSVSSPSPTLPSSPPSHAAPPPGTPSGTFQLHLRSNTTCSACTVPSPASRPLLLPTPPPISLPASPTSCSRVPWPRTLACRCSRNGSCTPVPWSGHATE